MVALAGLVDAGFSGDWQARGYLSDAAADTARTACLTAAAAHVVLTGAAGFIAKAKGEGIGAAMVTLAVRSRAGGRGSCSGGARWVGRAWIGIFAVVVSYVSLARSK